MSETFSRKVVVISSPLSGIRHGRVVAGELILALQRAGHTPMDVTGQSRSETYHNARRSAAQADAVVVVGGDGTIHLAAQIAMEYDLPLGVVPAGSGNDFARMMEIPRNVVKAIDRVILALDEPTPKVQRIDVLASRTDHADNGEIDYMVQAVSFGLDAEVNERANRMVMLDGTLRYVVASLQELARYQVWTYDLDLGGVPVEDLPAVRRWKGVQLDEEPDGFRVRVRRTALLVAIANGTTYGGGFRISPDADVADGYVDFVIADDVGGFGALLLFLQLSAGTHLNSAALTRIRVRRASIFTPVGEKPFKVYSDGEYQGTGRFEAEVAHRALRLLDPRFT